MRRYVVVVGVALVLGPASVWSQQDTTAPNATVWVSGGIGGGSEGIALLTEIAYQTGMHQYTLRAMIMAELYDDAVADIGFLYGRSRQTRNLNLAAGGGLGLIWTDHCPECNDIRAGIGIPAMARVMWHPVQGLGFGLYGFGNFNTLRSYGGFALMLSFGRVR